MTRLLALLALLGFSGCAHLAIIGKSDVEAICTAEYEAISARLEGRASFVGFDVEPGGTLLPKKEYLKRKADRERNPPEGLFEAVLSLGNDFPNIGARAQTIVWTDSEYILFTTSDEEYDIKATLVYTEGRTPFDLKELARAISGRYDKQKQLQPSDAGNSRHASQLTDHGN
jgi:hypothetical protein